MENTRPTAKFTPVTLTIPERDTANIALVTELERVFMPLYNRGADLMRQAALVQVSDVSQQGHMDTADNLLKQFRALRGEVTSAHKTVKDDYLKGGRMCDSVRRIFMEGIGPAEDYLTDQKNFAANQEKERVEKLRAARLLALDKFQDLVPMPSTDVALLTEDDFKTLLAGTEFRHGQETQKRAAERADILRKQLEEQQQRDKLEADAMEAKKVAAAAEQKLAQERLDNEAKRKELANLRGARSTALREVQALDMIPEDVTDLAEMAEDVWAALISAAQLRQNQYQQTAQERHTQLALVDPEYPRTPNLGTMDSADFALLLKAAAEVVAKKQATPVPPIAPLVALQGAQVASVTDEQMANGIADALNAFTAQIPAGMETQKGLDCITKFKAHLAQAEAWLRTQAPKLKDDNGNH